MRAVRRLGHEVTGVVPGLAGSSGALGLLGASRLGGRGSAGNVGRSGGGRGARRGARAGRGAGSGARDGEVDARLVGLVNGLGVPVPLDDAVTGGAALGAEVGGDGDVKVLVVVGDTGGGRGVDVPALQRAANDRVAGRVDNRDVGDTGVGSADVDDHGDLLAGGVFLDIVLVVGKLVTLAEPDVALGGLVVALRLGDLKLALDVAVVVRLLVVVDLLTAGGGHGSAGHTGLGRGDETVAVDGGSKSRKDDEGRLHFGGVFRLE